MATFQITNGVFSPNAVLKAQGGVVTVFPNNPGVTLYYWHYKEADGAWHSSSTLFTNGQSDSGVLPANRKTVLGTIQGAADGAYALTTTNEAPVNPQSGSTGDINIGSGAGEEPDPD